MFLVDESATDDSVNEEYNELVAALNQSLVTSMPVAEEENQLDEFPSVILKALLISDLFNLFISIDY